MQSNALLDFNEYLSGVRYAYIFVPLDETNFIKNNPYSGNAYMLSGLIKYLQEIGFSNVQWGDGSNIPQQMPSICELTRVSLYFTAANQKFSDISVNFVSCKNDYFRFNIDGHVNNDDNIVNVFYKKLLAAYGFQKRKYNPSNRLYLKNEMSEWWNEAALKSHFNKNGADAIEGIYENTNHTNTLAKYKMGVVKKGEGYHLIYFSGAFNSDDWQTGEIKAKLVPTATSTIYKAEWTMANKDINKDAYVTFNLGSMNVKFPNQDPNLYIKLFPVANEDKTNTRISSGTGFAISSNGYIVTCNHVVEGANKILVRGITNNFEKAYKAKVVLTDKNNDLAIIQIDDSTFKSISNIPFVIADKTIDVGSSVFALGYPLRSSMGDEIKLTNGIISSKSGFQGDITTYQISVPVQPGNSGGPLFDNNGDLVGIINAKNILAENASYAIKTSYLKNLLESLSSNPKLTTINTLSTKSLSEKVKVLKNFTFIIESN